jgi:hypothetical protein
LLDTHERRPGCLKTFAWLTPEMYASTATLPPYAATLLQLRFAPRVLVSRLHGLYLNHAVRPVTASRGATTRRPDCTSSTTPMPCIRTRRLAARLRVGRSHWLSPCVRSLRLAARLLVVRIAPALVRLCRASGGVVSTLDFSSVGRTGSRRVPDHSVVRRDYPSRGCNTSPTPPVSVPRHDAQLVAPLVVYYSASSRLIVDYCASVARPDASARLVAHHAARR